MRTCHYTRPRITDGAPHTGSLTFGCLPSPATPRICPPLPTPLCLRLWFYRAAIPPLPRLGRAPPFLFAKRTHWFARYAPTRVHLCNTHHTASSAGSPPVTTYTYLPRHRGLVRVLRTPRVPWLHCPTMRRLRFTCGCTTITVATTGSPYLPLPHTAPDATTPRISPLPTTTPYSAAAVHRAVPACPRLPFPTYHTPPYPYHAPRPVDPTPPPPPIVGDVTFSTLPMPLLLPHPIYSTHSTHTPMPLTYPHTTPTIHTHPHPTITFAPSIAIPGPGTR